MDCKIWEKTVLLWVNSIKSGTPLTKINQLNDAILLDIIKKFKCDVESPVDFLKTAFPNLSVSEFFTLASNYDFLTAATCLLIYISFSKQAALDELRNLMCKTLDNNTQQSIAAFLTSVGNHQNVFQLSFKSVTEEIIDFIDLYGSQSSVIGDGLSTPVKSNNVSNSSFDSPLQGFFQTPTRSQNKSEFKKFSSIMCGDGDHVKQIKQLQDNLAEEESEKIILQEKLVESIKKCNEYEMKLKDKMDEIKQLKHDWETESKKNEEDIFSLREIIKRKSDEEKNLKSDLSHLECFVSSLETDLANSLSEQVKLEHQLKLSLEKYSAYEKELKEMTEDNIKLHEILSQKEKELNVLKENFESCYKGEKCIDISFNNNSFDASIYSAETMDIVVDKLLKEKIEENSSLNEIIEDLRSEKNDLFSQIKDLKNDVLAKNSTISELQYLNKELCLKIEKFTDSENSLSRVQRDLIFANEEIDRLMKEICQLTEKCNSLDAKSEKNEQAFTECKNSKMLLQLDFLKLAHDFNSVQQRLETEVNNITKLTRCEGYPEYKAANEIVFDRTFELTETFRQKALGINDDCSTNDENMKKLQELLKCFENYDRDWSESKSSMQKACSQLNDSIVALKLKISDLEYERKNSLEEKMKLEACLDLAEKKISEIQSLHSSEIKKLKDELEKKAFKITELESYVMKLKDRKIDVAAEKEADINPTNKLPNNVTFIYEGGDFAKRSILSDMDQNLASTINKFPQIHVKEEMNDSLEEIPVCSKTFEIVNLDERDIIDKTFSIKKESLDAAPKETMNSSSWSVSPPSKIPSKASVKQTRRRTRGESWVVPVVPAKGKSGYQKVTYSSNNLTGVESSSNLTKSSSLSSIMEVTSSPPSKLESKISGATSFFSVTDLIGSRNRKCSADPGTDLRKAFSSELCLKDTKSYNSLSHGFKLDNRLEDPLADIFRGDILEYDGIKKREWNKKFSQMRKEIVELSNECERLRSALGECESKRKNEREAYEKNQVILSQSITSKYENQLEQLKTEMKQLYNRELAKHKSEQMKLNADLQEHNDNLRNQLWDVREKLLQEQKVKQELERLCSDLKKKYEKMLQTKEFDQKAHQTSDRFNHKLQGNDRMQNLRSISNGGFPTMPTEDEDEVFDNRFLEDLKKGRCPSPENPEDRLKELQNRNTLVLPHLKSSYPAETQFHNPSMYKEADLKFGLLQFGHESQSLTDSDHSMTRSLLPENKGKKKEQTSYKKPGPPTPSKHGGRLSLQSGDFRTTPRNVLQELMDPNEKNKGTPNRLRAFLPKKRESLSGGSIAVGLGRDENTVPITPRKKFFGKSGKILRKPFGARDH